MALKNFLIEVSMRRKLTWIAAFVGLVCLVALGVAVLRGVVVPNRHWVRRYPVKGVDVSAYQGEIDWPVLASQGVDFAYIKATEGSTFTDRCFIDNWTEAGGVELLSGAYHFFSYDSAGTAQAEHFIATVPHAPGRLPPAVDVEFYGDKERNPPDRADVVRELRAMLTRLEAHYGVAPVIYSTGKAYRMFLEGEFSEYPLWIRNVYWPPLFGSASQWTFWQYTDTARLSGYSGEERYIDMNAFTGDIESLRAMTTGGMDD